MDRSLFNDKQIVPNQPKIPDKEINPQSKQSMHSVELPDIQELQNSPQFLANRRSQSQQESGVDKESLKMSYCAQVDKHYPNCGVHSFDEARRVFDIAFTNGFTDFAVNQKIIEPWRGKLDSEPLDHEKIIEEIRSTNESSL